MSIIYPPVHLQVFFDNDGKVLANGFIRAYYHDTTDHAPTYNRSDEVNEWPLPLDASGRAQFKLSTDIAYDIETYDQNNALIETIPNVRLTSSGGGASPFDYVGMGLEISGDTPDRTLKITSEYDAGLVHTTGDEEIGGAKIFTQAVQTAGVISALDFSLLQPNTGSSVQSVVNSDDGNARVGFGVFADENGKTQINVNFTQRGVANNIVMNDSGKIGTPLNGDKTEIDPFVLRSELATQTTIMDDVNAGSIEWNLGAGNSLHLTTALTGDLTIDLSNPTTSVKNTLIFQQGSTVRAVTLACSGVAFRQAGNTSANSNTISLAGITTINAYRVVTLNWVSATICYISVD